MRKLRSLLKLLNEAGVRVYKTPELELDLTGKADSASTPSALFDDINTTESFSDRLNNSRNRKRTS